MNRELVANFDLTKFKHVAEYTKEKKVWQRVVESTEDQTVYIEAIDTSFEFLRKRIPYYKFQESIMTRS